MVSGDQSRQSGNGTHGVRETGEAAAGTRVLECMDPQGAAGSQRKGNVVLAATRMAWEGILRLWPHERRLGPGWVPPTSTLDVHGSPQLE